MQVFFLVFIFLNLKAIYIFNNILEHFKTHQWLTLFLSTSYIVTNLYTFPNSDPPDGDARRRQVFRQHRTAGSRSRRRGSSCLEERRLRAPSTGSRLSIWVCFVGKLEWINISSSISCIVLCNFGYVRLFCAKILSYLKFVNITR